MKTAVYREFRARIQDKRKVDLLALSLNAPLTDDTSRTLLDALPDNAHVVPKEFETVDLIARILSAATEREREAIALRISGYTSEEIAAMIKAHKDMGMLASVPRSLSKSYVDNTVKVRQRVIK